MRSVPPPRPSRRWAAALAAAVLACCAGLVADGGDKKNPAAVPDLTTIAGNPRERGRLYGSTFKKEIQAFLDREIYQAFVKKPAPKDEMLAYAAACAKVIRDECPVIHQELEGMAEGSGLELRELVLIMLHEELYHKGALPKVPHCTAVAVGPPDTVGGKTYVGQTWDWMQSVFGQSRVLLWQRDEGPSVLAYGFPGLWVGAGLNSSGLALCWTSAGLGEKGGGARVGVPAYVLLTHLLYQGSLEEVEREARRVTNAGWFTFVLADGKGNLLNVEGSPKKVVVERHKGRLARIGFGSCAMTGAATPAEVKLHARCRKMYDLLEGAAGKVDRGRMQEFFAEPKYGISVGKDTIDLMVFDTAAREAFVSRGPSYGVEWKRFGFDGAK